MWTKKYHKLHRLRCYGELFCWFIQKLKGARLDLRDTQLGLRNLAWSVEIPGLHFGYLSCHLYCRIFVSSQVRRITWLSAPFPLLHNGPIKGKVTMVETEILQGTGYVSSYQVSQGNIFDDILVLRVGSFHILLSVHCLPSFSPYFDCNFFWRCILPICWLKGTVIRNLGELHMGCHMLLRKLECLLRNS